MAQYYGYLFESNKQPTKVLDALLRGIAGYISDKLGDVNEKCLTPAKLAAFYKAVGGNYDSLFVDVPHPSISWIYASIGCQHTLQPLPNPYRPPSIPCLTPTGFARWETIEILLGPDEHAPFIQYAVANFSIKHPDTGEIFPADLPREAFPEKADAEIERWHSRCAAKLRAQATPELTPEEEIPPLPPRPRYATGSFAHVRPPHSGSGSRERDREWERERGRGYFGPAEQSRRSRDIPYQHVASAGRPVRPGLNHHPRHRAFLSPESPESPRLACGRRRSFPDNTSPLASPAINQTQPASPSEQRRHSHPRQVRRGSVGSDASDEESPVPTAGDGKRGSTPEIRVRNSSEEELKRRSQIPIDLSGKLSAPFLLGRRNTERDTSSRPRGGGGGVRWQDLGAGREVFRDGNGNGNGNGSSGNGGGGGSGTASRGDGEGEESGSAGSGGGRRSGERRRRVNRESVDEGRGGYPSSYGSGPSTGGSMGPPAMAMGQGRRYREREKEREREREPSWA